MRARAVPVGACVLLQYRRHTAVTGRRLRLACDVGEGAVDSQLRIICAACLLSTNEERIAARKSLAVG